MKTISGKLLAASARLSAAALASSFAFAAHGGISEREYLDLSKWDVSDYVPGGGGLLVHYDGIRNVGADQPHSSAKSTTVWRNLAPGHTDDWPAYWASHKKNSSGKYPRIKNDNSQGEWGANGFVFNGQVAWMKWNEGETFTLPATYTMQFAITAKTADQTGANSVGYLFMPHSSYGWSKGCVHIRHDAISGTVAADSIYAVDAERLGSTNVRPYFSNPTPNYATIMADSEAMRAFEGTTLPASGDTGYASITGKPPARPMNWFAIGTVGDEANSVSALAGFHGTLHSYRLYARTLTEYELKQNRIVDEARFFGRRTPISVTNAVIASTYSFLDGKEPAGIYAVDDSHVFTAPATVEIGDFAYACTGCTIETWNYATESWGDPVMNNGVLSVTISASDRKRVTWLWKATRAAHTADDYTLADYSPAGLVLNYDGIRNDGADNPHNTSATKWKNLATGWEDQDMYWVSYIEKANTAGEYSADRWNRTKGAWNATSGFDFDGEECFMKWNEGRKFILPPAYTWQFAMDATTADQSEGTGLNGGSNGGVSYLFLPHAGNSYGSWQSGSVSMRATALAAAKIPADSIVLTDETRYDGTNVRPYFSDPSSRFATVLADSTAACVFDGVDIPTSEPGYKEGAMATTRTNNWFAIGGQYNPYSGKTLANFQGFRGTMHSVRFYDRPLTEEELERNREADSARFFKELATTNVVVSINGVETAYKVEGEWTFDAPATVTVDNVEKSVAGYRLYERVNGDWKKMEPFQSGREFTYDEDEYGGKTIKLEWAPEPPGMMIIVRCLISGPQIFLLRNHPGPLAERALAVAMPSPPPLGSGAESPRGLKGAGWGVAPPYP